MKLILTRLLVVTILGFSGIAFSACGPDESGETDVNETEVVEDGDPEDVGEVTDNPGDDPASEEAEAVEQLPVIGCAAFDSDELYVDARDIKASLEDPDCLDDQIVFVDARDNLNFQSGHIPGAINAPYHSVEAYTDELPKDKWLVLYCECPRAEAVQAAKKLQEEAQGYTMLKVMGDGLGGWRDVDGEIVTEVSPSSDS